MFHLPPPDPVVIPATAVDVAAIGGAGMLVGWGLRETAGAVATVRLVDGVDANGQLLVPFNLSANESTRDYPPGWGLPFERGLAFDMVAGTVEAVLWVVLDFDLRAFRRWAAAQLAAIAPTP